MQAGQTGRDGAGNGKHLPQPTGAARRPERRPASTACNRLRSVIPLTLRSESCVVLAPCSAPSRRRPSPTSGTCVRRDAGGVLALMGEPASTEAENSLIRLRKAFDALPFPLKAHSDSLFTWGEERLRFTESLAIPISATTAGLTRRKIGHWRSIQQMTSAVRHRLSCNGQCVWWGLVTYSRAFATPKLL